MASILDKPVAADEKRMVAVVPPPQDIQLNHPTLNPKSAAGSKRKDLFKGIKQFQQERGKTPLQFQSRGQ